MFPFYDNITSPRNMEAAMHVASGLQQAFWQNLTCSFHKQLRKNVYSKLADNSVYNSLKNYSKLITVKLEQCIKWYLQEFDWSPTVFNSVINYLHDAIYGVVINDHITVGAVTLLHYQQINQNGSDKSGVGNPQTGFLPVFLKKDKGNTHFNRNPHLYKMEKLFACQKLCRKYSGAIMCQKTKVHQQ